MKKLVEELFLSVLGHYSLIDHTKDVTVTTRINVCYRNPLNFPMNS